MIAPVRTTLAGPPPPPPPPQFAEADPDSRALRTSPEAGIEAETDAGDETVPAAPDAPVVQIEGLWTIFGSGASAAVVHQDLNLTIGRGEIVSLVGGSGSGKTTLFRQILGLAHPSRGMVRVLGRPPAELGGRGAATRIGMLFQRGALFSAFSVLDNIGFALRELQTVPEALIHAAAMVKLRMVGLEPADAAKMPSDLSGGMIKRVALARALAMDPPLLLLDEPTAGLDPAASDDFCDLLASLHRELGLTVIMVTHDLDTVVELSTQVAVLADKRVIINAPLAEVVAFPHPFIEEYFLGKRGQRALTALRRERPAAPPNT